MNTLIEKLTEINEKRTNVILLRSKVEWIDGAEKTQNISQTAEKKNISNLTNNSSETDKTDDILSET